jgi:hypothetical protein
MFAAGLQVSMFAAGLQVSMFAAGLQVSMFAAGCHLWPIHLLQQHNSRWTGVHDECTEMDAG